MKIAQIMPEFGLAGAEIMCENLTYELVKAGHEVVVISMYDYHSAITDRLEQAGVEIRYLGKKPGLDVSMIPKMWKCSVLVNRWFRILKSRIMRRSWKVSPAWTWILRAE